MGHRRDFPDGEWKEPQEWEGGGPWVLDTQEDVSRPSASVSERSQEGRQAGEGAAWGRSLHLQSLVVASPAS